MLTLQILKDRGRCCPLKPPGTRLAQGLLGAGQLGQAWLCRRADPTGKINQLANFQWTEPTDIIFSSCYLR